MNHPQRPSPVSRDQARQEALEWLKRRWPRAFGNPVPLCLGANERILEACENDPHAPDVATVKDALRAWVRHPDYLRRVAAGDPRHDLEGQEVEPVTSEHQAHARIRYREIKRRRDPEVATSGSS
ncbi:ProQ/FinO family protein [Ectothiorhodospira haloalkaliphila]|uniref:ProQ/FINO family protein n=1 Tax=Ectothiorhodospira haloalkaliphila TaxID=421628 RepID=UPI001EE93F47|nr:ProQ/FinO family protein [Ectothiorhodospira haloalkaliphila]